MDVVLCQANREYLDHLQRYNRLLSQRNALLRSDGFHADRILLRTYSRSMKDSAHFIFTERSRLSQKLLPAVMEYYAILSSAKEKPSLQYLSQISEYDFEKIAEASIESDIQNGRTTKGVHKDDLDILLDERQVKRFGSQGQIKSLLIAMHLAQLSFLRKELDSTPVLLLDDIFDRLDEQRAHQLISILTSDHVDQVFISDASPRRVHELMSAGIADAQIVYVQDGTVLSVSDMGDDRENANLQHDDEEE